jgi:uncharacterized membrane protein
VTGSREHIVSRTLQAGIALSGGLMLVGFVLYAFQPEYHNVDYPAATWAWFHGMWTLPVGEIISSPFIYLYAGIFVLMLTPIVRIIITGITFFLEGDWRYVWISVIVLGVIGISIAFAIVH